MHTSANVRVPSHPSNGGDYLGFEASLVARSDCSVKPRLASSPIAQSQVQAPATQGELVGTAHLPGQV